MRPEWIYLPSPLEVQRRLEERSWDEDVSDDDRLVLELGWRTIEQLATRCCTLAQALEKSEAGL